MKQFDLLLPVLVLGCTARPNLEAERKAVFAADSAWLAAAQSRNVDSSVSFWTADARIISPGQPPTIGHDAIHKMVADGFATPDFSITWHTDEVVVSPAGDVAYSFGSNVITAPGAAGRIDTLHGQGVVLWQKGNDGRWRAAVDFSTPAP